MTTATDRLVQDMARQANRSGLSREDQARAMALAAIRIKSFGSEDPVERLANDMADDAVRYAPGAPKERLAFLEELGADLDIQAITLEGVIHGDARETRKATLSIVNGEACDLGGISAEGAKPFIEAVTADIRDLVSEDARISAANALTGSMGALPQTSPLGSDEMLMGAFQALGVRDARKLSPAVAERITRIISVLMMR